MQIDVKDKKILYELDRDCRQSNSQIARKVHLSKQVVNYRIKRLEEKNIITKYVAQLNTPKLGYITHKIMIQFQHVNPEKEKEIFNHVSKNKNVNWLVSSFGQYDLIFAFSSTSIIEFNKNLKKLLSNFESNIKEKKTLLITDLYHFTRSYLINKKDKSVSHFGGEPEKSKLDKVDFQIIKILSNNAHDNIVDIAKKLNMTIDVIRYRIKKLNENKIIQSYRAVINKELLNYNYWSILIQTPDLTETEEKQLITYLKQIPSVVFASKYMDDYTFGFEVEVKDIKELQEILTDFRYKFSKFIEAYETILFIKEYKVNYLPKQ